MGREIIQNIFVVGKLGKLDYVLKSNQMNILKEKFASNCLNLVVDDSAISLSQNCHHN